MGWLIISLTFPITQIHELNNVSKADIKANCSTNIVSPPTNDLEKFEAVLKNKEADDEGLLRRILDLLKGIKTNDKLSVLEDCYCFDLKLHSYHQYIFDPAYTNMSEAAFVNKIWSPLFMIMFRSLRQHFSVIVIMHWGETTNPHLKQDRIDLRMDLRFIVSSLAEPNNTVYVGTNELHHVILIARIIKINLKQLQLASPS